VLFFFLLAVVSFVLLFFLFVLFVCGFSSCLNNGE